MAEEHNEEHEINIMKNDMREIKHSLRSIADALKTLAVLEDNSRRFDKHIGELRAKMQELDVSIAKLPSEAVLDDVFKRLRIVENKHVGIESKLSAVYGVITLIILTASAYAAYTHA